MVVSKVAEQLTLWSFFAMMMLLPIPKAGMLLGTLPIVIGLTALMLLLSIIQFTSAKDHVTIMSFSTRHVTNNILPWLVVYITFLIVFCLLVWVWPEMFGWKRLFNDDIVYSNLVSLVDIPASAESKIRSLSLLGFFSVLWFACWKTSHLNQAQLKYLLIVFFIASLFQAIFGLWHFLSQQSSILGIWEKQHYLKDVTGTFVNRNHFAGFLAVCWPIVLSGLLAKKTLLLSNVSHHRRVLIAVFYSLIIFLAIVASHSRMGSFAALFGVAVCLYLIKKESAVFNQFSYKRGKRPMGDKVISYMKSKWLLGLAFLLFVIWFGVDDLLERYLLLENGDSRFAVWSALFDLPFSALLLGVGPGAFADIFPLVQPSYFAVRFEYAHNDYLEFLFEFGLIGTSILILSLVYWAWSVFPKGDLSMRAGAIGAIAAMSLHSFVDFTLQIPASALYFWIAVGLVMNPHMLSESDK